MIPFCDLCCPRCGAILRQGPSTPLACGACAVEFDGIDGIVDLCTARNREIEPEPLARADFAPAFAAHAAGTPFKALLEALLLALPDDRADRLMLMLRESRSTWHPLVSSSGGECLFIGNALSGTITPLARAGFRVTVLDRAPERVHFAAIRSLEHTPGLTRCIVGGDGPRLPFPGGAFDLVVQEGGLPGRGGLFAHDLDECRRVCRGEIVLTADNRLAYKRSSGRRGDFRLRNPIEYAASALGTAGRERTLAGYRRALATADFTSVRAFALYPDARDFSHVVAIDSATPGLTVGPKERQNRLKLIGRKLGLFPVFTPSFALIAGRAPARPRIDRILRELAERIGEPAPEIDQLVGTRGNTAVIHTQSRTAGGDGDAGRWTLHMALCPKNGPQFARHHRVLGIVRARFPRVPVPEPLFAGVVDGIELTCERRARGWSAPQICGDLPRTARMLTDAAGHFSTLVVRPPIALTPEVFDAQVAARFEIVMRFAAVPSTIANLQRLLDTTRERLIGRPLPLVFYHSDLRSKHVQVDVDGRVIAYLDWGTSEPEGLPCFDLLHLLVHERKQEAGLSARDAWQLVLDGARLRDHERACLASYARAVGVEADVAQAIIAIYPVLVAAMAEKNWDYSRPRWLHRQFGV